jgi:predicted regulator of Ras-like GTPase activity (Roadblock/LC7/MglB family)
MFASLFGALRTGGEQGSGQADDQGFPLTVQEPAGEDRFSIHHQVADEPHTHNLFVTGSAAQAIRDHFRRTRADLGDSTRMVTLLDPAVRRASDLLEALSEATQAPVERLHLRDQATLGTLALIERATVQRRDHDHLKVYHAQARGAGSEEAEIVHALMERSQLSAVLLDEVEAEVALETVMRLEEAAQHSTWRCPLLAFFVSAEAPSLARRIRTGAWPAGVHVEVITESVRGSSALWNALLDLWARQREAQAAQQVTAGQMLADLPDPVLIQRVLAQLEHVDGVQAGALVDAAAGTLITGKVLPQYETVVPHLPRAALACSLALRAQQHAARTMGLSPVEELTVTAGDHIHILRTLSARPGVFLLALLDRRRTNLALARFTLLEAEKSLG